MSGTPPDNAAIIFDRLGKSFPKSGGGYDPLTAAPAPITPEQRKEAGVDAPVTKDVPSEA